MNTEDLRLEKLFVVEKAEAFRCPEPFRFDAARRRAAPVLKIS